MSAPTSAAEIREAFLRFFEQKTHRRVASSSLVPAADPTLLFTNAGMVQFKDVFTGRETRDYTRSTSVQKCVRAGGKHNDLDNVGFTARHHTFFEMLGNFSFGDYFKADAIAWAWEFVTQVLKLPADRLSVTVFKGEDGIPADEEAYELWRKQGVPEARIRRLGLADNFWAMGDTGACGPCSEIYFYQPNHPVKEGEHAGESDNWLEIWNLVFMQFDRKVAGGPLIALPKPSIDTGAGLERVTSVVQRQPSNYDTDLFQPLLHLTAKLSGKRYGQDASDDASMRVVADHARATAFLIGDGVQPSNEGRGYVLRRIMRRAIRHGARLGLDEPFLHTVVDAVVTMMSPAYPGLTEQRSFLLEATQHEEESFRRTLARGLKMIDDEVARLTKTGEKTVPGDAVFFLHDTHGFPWDLTQIIVRERGFDVDLPGFHAAMEKARETSSSGGLSSEKGVSDVHMQLAGTLKETAFLGFDGDAGKGTVQAIIKAGQQVQVAKAGDSVELVLDRSPFYGESGGQVGDTGSMSAKGVRVEVTDTRKPTGGMVVHLGRVAEGSVAVGDALELAVDAERRNRIRANHSATHLLHKALKVVLGTHVNQKGSVVQPEQLRFDFSHFSPLKPEELNRVEDLVNGWIRQNAATATRVMKIDEARAAGAVALFGEKYGDQVRVVTVHPESVELCGGTHVARTGDIGLLRITQESSIASGVRRIVALTGQAAVEQAREVELELRRASELFKSTPQELVKRIEALQKRSKELEKKVEELTVKAQTGSADAGESVNEVNGIKLLMQRVDPADANVLRTMADRYRDKLQSGVVGLGGETADGKALILVAATKDIVARGFKAGDAVREMALHVGGKGGGKPDMAQAGGTDATKLSLAFDALRGLVESVKRP